MKRYNPSAGEPYYMINSRWHVKQTVNVGTAKSLGRIKVGNCFETYEEAETFCEEIKAGAVKPRRRWGIF